MFISYDGIVFDVLLLNTWAIDEVRSKDDVDFLYWRHTIDVTCILNPNVNGTNLFTPRQQGQANQKVFDGFQNAEEAQTAIDQTALGNDQVAEGVSFPGTPLNTAIDVADSADTPPDPNDITNYFVDQYGNQSQEAGDGSTPTYDAVTEFAPGVPYTGGLEDKVNYVKVPSTGAWIEEKPINVMPATLDGTDTLYADNPLRLAPFQLTGNVAAGAVNGAAPPTFLNPPPPPLPRVQFGGNPRMPATDTELRSRLAVPRRTLLVWLNSGPGGNPEFILASPYDGCTVDAKDGPKCTMMPTLQIHGNVTGIKRLVFTCCEALPLFFKDKYESKVGTRPGGVNQIDVANDNANNQQQVLATPPIISNRWQMAQRPDKKTWLNSTIIKGVAVFRMDVLSRLKITADQLRPYIMPPLPFGYVREPPEVALGGDGATIEYTIVDNQVVMNNPGGVRWGVHSVVVHEGVEYNNPVDYTQTFPDIIRPQR